MVVALSLSACTGLTVPDGVDATLMATNDMGLELDMWANAKGACHGSSPYVLNISGSQSEGALVLKVDGYENGGDLNGACADLGEARGGYELPAIPIGEDLRLDVSLGGELNTYVIARTNDTVTVAKLSGSNVGLRCSSSWTASVLCELQPSAG